MSAASLVDESRLSVCRPRRRIYARIFKIFANRETNADENVGRGGQHTIYYTTRATTDEIHVLCNKMCRCWLREGPRSLRACTQALRALNASANSVLSSACAAMLLGGTNSCLPTCSVLIVSAKTTTTYRRIMCECKRHVLCNDNHLYGIYRHSCVCVVHKHTLRSSAAARPRKHYYSRAHKL